MTESVLRDYFENLVSTEFLSNDLNGSISKLTYDTSQIEIIKVESNSEFEVKPHHIEKILNDAINKKLTFDNVKTVASGLMFSEYFYWDSDTETGNRIATIIVELDNTEINFPITIENLKSWKEYLISGIHNLKAK